MSNVSVEELLKIYSSTLDEYRSSPLDYFPYNVVLRAADECRDIIIEYESIREQPCNNMDQYWSIRPDIELTKNKMKAQFKLACITFDTRDGLNVDDL